MSTLKFGEDQESNGLYKGDKGAFDTYTKRIVNPLNMTADDIDITDIAHALSLQCRYNGHCYGHLSVARHSIWVANRLAKEGWPRLQLWGLLHDAAEAYLGDLIRPLKHSDFAAEYRRLEEKAEQAIADKFRLPWPMPKPVKDADIHVGVQIEMPYPNGKRWTWDHSPKEDEADFMFWFKEFGG